MVIWNLMNGLIHINDYCSVEPLSFFPIDKLKEGSLEIDSTHIENNSSKINQNLKEVFKKIRLKRGKKY